jgi:hypothetical protein
MIEEEIFLKPNETLKYIESNVNPHDTLELSYNRVYAPGEVLGVEIEDDFGEDAIIVTLHLSGDLVNDVVRVNMNDIIGDLLEIRHINDKKDVTVVVQD